MGHTMGGPDHGTPSNDPHAFYQEQATSELDQSISDRQQEILTESRQRIDPAKPRAPVFSRRLVAMED
jgi:hypothetical protein